MICGIIDIGSNTIRLSTYEYNGKQVKKLFHKKSTAGLANYIKDNYMDEGGIDRCCEVLMDFKDTIDLLPIDIIEIFATASLRNIQNSTEAVSKIHQKTGYKIQILSGYEEAMYGYYGIRSVFEMEKGLVVDIGGGSTEFTLFEKENIKYADSFPVGSLNLYQKNVSKIIPSEKEKQDMRKQVRETIGSEVFKKIRKCGGMVAVGGSARGILKIANELLQLSEDNQSLNLEQLEKLNSMVKKESKLIKLILKTCPDRIHTLVPGLIILISILKESKENALKVSPYGVREGYLVKKILGSDIPSEIV